MTLTLRLDDAPHSLTLRALKPELLAELDGVVHRLKEIASEGGRRTVEIDGQPVSCRLARSGNTVYLHLDGRAWTVELIDPRDAARADAAGEDAIRAPMPGAVVSIEKAAGETVRLGETVMTIESMKLLTSLAAPRDGVIAEIFKEVGETFDKDAVIAALVPETDDA